MNKKRIEEALECLSSIHNTQMTNWDRDPYDYDVFDDDDERFGKIYNLLHELLKEGVVR